MVFYINLVYVLKCFIINIIPIIYKISLEHI